MSSRIWAAARPLPQYCVRARIPERRSESAPHRLARRYGVPAEKQSIERGSRRVPPNPRGIKLHVYRRWNNRARTADRARRDVRATRLTEALEHARDTDRA